MTHEWKVGDKAMVEVKIQSVENDTGYLLANGKLYKPSMLHPIKSDWMEKWEERTESGHKVLFVTEVNGVSYGLAEGHYSGLILLTETHLISKYQPVPPKKEKRWRPWTAEEARGKWVREKISGSTWAINGVASDGRFHIGCCYFSPQKTMERFEQLNGEPCGTLEEE